MWMVVYEAVWLVGLVFGNTVLILICDMIHTQQSWPVGLFASISLVVVTWRTWRLWDRYGDHLLIVPILLIENILVVAMFSTFAIVLEHQVGNSVIETYLMRWYTGIMLVAGLGYTPIVDTKWSLLVIDFVTVIYVNIVLRNAVFLMLVSKTNDHKRTPTGPEGVRFLLRPL